MTELMIGCIWHGLDALQGTRAKPGNHLTRLTLATRQFAIGESRSLLAKKKQDPSPIWLNFFIFLFLGLPLVVCILFEDIRVLGLFTGRQ